MDGPVLADVPAASLSDDAPLYDRPRHAPASPPRPSRRRRRPPPTAPPTSWRCCARPRWVWRQYDHQLFLNTVAGPGADAALLRLAGPGLPPSERGVAITTDSNPRACALDPRAGTALVLAEGVANLACVGATAGRRRELPQLRQPGTPRGHVAALRVHRRDGGGLRRVCRCPVIGGNVSLYNESGGSDIDPTPVLGVLGLVDAVRAQPPGPAWSDGDAVVLLGARAAADGTFPLEGTRWATERRDHRCRHRGCRPSTSRRTRRCARSSPGSSPIRSARASAAPGWCAPSTTCRAAASPWPWPRWRPPAPRAAPLAGIDAGRAVHRAAVALRAGHGGSRRAVRPGRRRAASRPPCSGPGGRRAARPSGIVVDLPLDAVGAAEDLNLARALGDGDAACARMVTA